MVGKSTETVPTKRACDSCHRRKIKCIGEGTAPCKNCVSAGLVCIYNAIPQKKGPKGSRAKVLSELRGTQRNVQLAAGSPTDLEFNSRSLSSTFGRTPGLMPPAFVESCIEYFFAHVYPSEPVLHRQRVQEAAIGMDRWKEAYCMVVALCAYVMIRANHKPPVSVLPRPEMAHMSNVGIGHILLEESVRVRQGYDHRENPTHYSVLTLWFYSGCYFVLARENTAWTYLRDATTQAQLLGMHDEETYKHDPLDISRKRVLYWLLFIAERTYALRKHHPISLHPTIHLPSLDEVLSDRPIAVGLELMINMFRIIDDTFINLWNRVHNTHASAAWITQVQTQLSGAVPAYFECTEVQEVQIRITQQWLRSQAWQLSACQGLVSSVSNDIPLTFKYPIEIARDLLTISHQFSQQAMEVHGVGLTEKLFDIACCLTDVVACTSFSPALGPRDYVSRFLTLISTLRGGRTRYLPLLLAKLSEVLPNLPLPRSLNLPQTVPAGTLGLDATGSGKHPSNIADDYSLNPNIKSLSCVSNNLTRQPGAQPPLNTTQHSMANVPTTHVGDMSLYDSSHSTAHSHSSSPAPGSTSTTTNPYETPVSPSGSQIVGHPTMELPTSYGHRQSHHMDVNATAYDPRFSIQSYPIDPMMYRQ